MIDKLFSIFQSCSGISTDSRNIKGGELFIALKGPSFNGNKFAQKALDSGAKFAVVDEADFVTGEQTILVQDGLTALQQLANQYRKQFDIPVIAVTGSNGKTTTKELLFQVLSKKYNTWATQGNLNNHIGVPLTLLAMPQNTEVAIIEMGDNKIGDVTELCQIANPTHGFITNIGKDHIEGFGSFEGNIRAKSEVFHYLIKENGIAFINAQDAILKNMAKRFESPIFYGSENTYSHLKYLDTNPYIRYENEQGLTMQTQLFGKYNFENIQTAACIGKFLNVSDSAIHQAICDYSPKNNRSQILDTASNTLILDAYNANPSSMQAALESLQEINTTKTKVAILGDMLELGSISLTEHKAMVELAKQLKVDQVLFCGKEFYKVQDGQQLFFENKNELADYIKIHPIQDAYILLKGSRGVGLESLQDLLK